MSASINLGSDRTSCYCYECENNKLLNTSGKTCPSLDYNASCASDFPYTAPSGIRKWAPADAGATGPPLQNLGGSGCHRGAPCSACKGDCDSDSDCAPGHKCFQRNAFEQVPGCAVGGPGDVSGYDYCAAPIVGEHPMSTSSCDCETNVVPYEEWIPGGCSIRIKDGTPIWNSQPSSSGGPLYSLVCQGETHERQPLKNEGKACLRKCGGYGPCPTFCGGGKCCLKGNSSQTCGDEGTSSRFATCTSESSSSNALPHADAVFSQA